MKDTNPSLQYNNVAHEFEAQFGEMNKKSVIALNTVLEPLLTENIKNAVDLGCGLGDMILYLKTKGITCAGVDSSHEMARMAVNNTGADIRLKDFRYTAFSSETFDLVTSKWAIQTIDWIDDVYMEAARLLKKGGYFVFLTVHPIRQFLEKKKVGKDYFEKEIVDSIIFDGTIIVHEPSHTLKEYLSETFLSLFTLQGIDEGHEFPAAEQIGGDIYPTYLIITAQKK